MGLSMLPDELLLSVLEQWPCREAQIKQLATLLSPSSLVPSTTVIHGPRATGKSSILRSFLETYNQRHAIVQCRECITGRHLLERTITAVRESMRDDAPNGEHTDSSVRCENLSVLTATLQRLLGKAERFILAFDGVDKQRDAQPTLLPALARLGEFIPNLKVILIVQHPPARFLYQAGIPYIYFPAYTRNQSIHILSRKPPDIFLEPPPPELEYDKQVHEEDKAWLWPRFCAAVWDSLAQNAARDFVSFCEVCMRLWRPFVAPVITGEFGTRDFSRLLVSQRRLFQDEDVLLESIVPKGSTSGDAAKRQREQDLPYYTKWLLIAAYLASYNPAKLDALYFMKSTERKRKKKGGGTARSGGRPSQTRKVPRHLLAPSAFTLDRLLSILHAILPHDFRSTIEIYTQIATLSSLRLLVRSGGIGSADPLEPGGKWRVGAAVTWESIQAIARSLKFDLDDYIAE